MTTLTNADIIAHAGDVLIDRLILGERGHFSVPRLAKMVGVSPARLRAALAAYRYGPPPGWSVVVTRRASHYSDKGDVRAYAAGRGLLVDKIVRLRAARDAGGAA